MSRFSTGRGVCVFLLVAALLLPAAPAQRVWRPKLLVVLVVDQMRTDYLERYGRNWTGGLRRLADQGAWFTNAAYPYLNTVTCAGHATIATGTFPARHGMILNEWWDRASGAEVACTDDAQASPVAYTGQPRRSHSAHRLLLSTLADELRTQTSGRSRVVALSLKARSAIMLAGHGGDAVTWFDENAGAWTTSTAFTSTPVPFIAEFIKANPVEADLGKTWVRLRPEASYSSGDDVPGERPGAGWTASFPHEIRGRAESPDSTFYNRWRRSPFSDAYLGRMARAAVDALRVGQSAHTDFLGVSFSALDLVGHWFGPQSHEVQDILARLDGTIGELLAHLDRTVGGDNYVVALSSDHGVSEIPEQIAGAGAGRIRAADVAQAVDRALSMRFGQARYVARVRHTDVYLLPGVYDRLRAHDAAMQAVLAALGAVPGIARVFRSEQIPALRASSDATERAVALSYFPARSGDLIIVPHRFWITSSDAATHGTAQDYDARVPLILMGRSIRRGRYAQAATPADIAPTLAFLAGAKLENRDGRVLEEALAVPRPRSRPHPQAAVPPR